MSILDSCSSFSSTRSRVTEKNAKGQLFSLFNYIGESFGKEINSVNEATSVIGKFVKKYLASEETLKIVKDENNSLKEELNGLINRSTMGELEIEDKTKNEEILYKKLRSYKKKLADAQDDNTKKNSQMLQLIQKIEKSNAEIKNLKIKIEALEKEKNENSKIIEEPKQNTQSIETTVKLFEDLVLSQEETIQRYSSQQAKLINIIHKLDQVSSVELSKLAETNNEKAELEKEIIEMKNTIETLQQENENIMNQFNEEVPDDLKEEINKSDTPIKSYIQQLKKEIEQKPKVIIKEPEVPKEEMIEKKKYIELMHYLEDTLILLKSVAEGTYEPLGTNTKDVILTQCARIGNWVDMNLSEIGYQNIPKQYSIFDPNAFAGPKEQLEAFYKICSEKEMQQSPVKELFCLFSGMCDLNSLLFKLNERLTTKTANYHISEQSTIMLTKAQNENLDLHEENEKLKDIVKSLEVTLRALTGKEDGKIEEMIEEVKARNIEINENIATLEQSIEESKKQNEEKEQINNKLLESLQTIQTENQNIKQQKEEQTKEIERLKAQIKQHEEEIEKEKEENENVKKELKTKTKKYKETSNKCKEIQSMVSVIENKMRKLMSDNENLADAYNQLKGKCEQQEEQIIAICEVEQKLRGSRDKLKQRIIKLQKQNEELIQSTLATVK